MFCHTENVLFEMLACAHENPVEDAEGTNTGYGGEFEQERTRHVVLRRRAGPDHPKAQIAHSSRLKEAPAVISMAPGEAENVDVEPEAVPEPDVTRTRLPRACKQAANTSQVPLNRRRRND